MTSLMCYLTKKIPFDGKLNFLTHKLQISEDKEQYMLLLKFNRLSIDKKSRSLLYEKRAYNKIPTNGNSHIT